MSKRLYRNVATFLKNTRANRGETQAQFAKRVKLSRGFLSEIEAGVKVPSLPRLVVIADRLNVTLDELCGRA